MLSWAVTSFLRCPAWAGARRAALAAEALAEAGLAGTSQEQGLGSNQCHPPGLFSVLGSGQFPPGQDLVCVLGKSQSSSDRRG